MRPAPSVWERVLGADVELLHPSLRAYTAPIPPGSVGRGRGTMEVLGAVSPLVRLGIALLAPRGTVFPVVARDVPFTVENRGRRGAVEAVRRFEVDGRAFTMRDRMAASRGAVLDRLGDERRLLSRFDARVVEGRLELESTAVAVRVAGAPLRIPRAVAPRIRLVERHDEPTGLQRVTVTVDLPVLGRIYEYSGAFAYEIVADTDPAVQT